MKPEFGSILVDYFIIAFSDSETNKPSQGLVDWVQREILVGSAL
jgi:hypothetical protein